MAEPLTDKELAEFRRRVDGLHDMSLGTSMRVGWERRILATIADLQAQLQQAQEVANLGSEGVAHLGQEVEVLKAERDAAIERGKRLWLLTSIYWIRTCEYWQRQADAARTDGAMSAARDDFWNLLAKLDERAEAAEALVLRIHKVCKHTLEGGRSSGWYKMVVFDIGQLTTPAEAQARQEEE